MPYAARKISRAERCALKNGALQRIHERRGHEVSCHGTRWSRCRLSAGGGQATFGGERHQHQGYKGRYEALARRTLFQTIDPTE